ncbi:hypothetical protein PMAYCL1PPCAC_17951, partial [Pristionchus mayeri]
MEMSVMMRDEPEKEAVERSESTTDEKEMSIPKRSEKITLSGGKEEEERVDNSSDSSALLTTPLSSQTVSEDCSPIKAMEGEGESIPRTPANRGTFEPVGILSSSKKSKSEKKKGGVHFKIVDEEKIVEVDEEVVKDGEKDKEDEENAVVFPLLRDNEDSVDSILLKLGSNSRMMKISLEKIGVKTIGELASCGAKEINGLLGIRPPKWSTVQKALEGVLARSQKSASKPLPPICTPEKKKEDTDVSPNKAALPPLELSPIQKNRSPPKSKPLQSRKRLALESPVRMKRSKIGEEEDNQMEIVKEEEKEKKVIEEEKKEKEAIDEEKKENEAIEEDEKESMVEDKNMEVMENREGTMEENGEESIEVVGVAKGVEDGVDRKEDSSTASDSIVILENTFSPLISHSDVISFISRLKGAVSLPALLRAQEQVSVAFFDAIREATVSTHLH